MITTPYAVITLNPLAVLTAYGFVPGRIDVPGWRIDAATVPTVDPTDTYALVSVAYVNTAPDSLSTVSGQSLSYANGVLTVTQTWAPPTQSALTAYANEVQWAKATGGYVLAFSGGPTVPFDTSVEGMALITGKVARLGQPNPPASFDWQTGPNTFATITAAQITTAGIQIADYVQATFNSLATLFAGITAGTITAQAQIDGASWPTPAGTA